MGEFADMANERWIDGDWEEDEEEGPFPTTKTCRHCGQEGLMWNHTDRGWRLWDGLKMHACHAFQCRKASSPAPTSPRKPSS